ncbi:MAG TPA: Ig-like domain-containing protein, partial [Terriglobales bacterium]|nr:Ig-like domain-containing protein [Terriglobales bacterium]
TVTAQDTYNNTATSYAGTVHFTSSDAKATLPVNSPLTSGTKSFSVTFGTAGTQNLTATDTVTAGITGFASATVNPGAATQFVFQALPAFANAGSSFAFRLTALDVDGNTATGYTGTVHFTSSDPHPAALPANYTFTVGALKDNGKHIFNATLFTTASQSITATDTVTASIKGTANETVHPAATSKLSVTAPASVNAGVAFNVTVTAQDAFGNTTPAYGGTVHLTSTDPLATLGADSTLISGVGTFASKLQTTPTQHITATDTVTGTITGTSNAITVNKSNTSVTLTASLNPMYFRHRGTLTATVHVTGGSGKTTGTVQFKSGSTVLGTVIVAANGTAGLAVPELRFNTYSVTATYSGDANYNTSTSPALTFKVRPAP